MINGFVINTAQLVALETGQFILKLRDLRGNERLIMFERELMCSLTDAVNTLRAADNYKPQKGDIN